MTGIPLGTCQCGCGRPTPLAKRTSKSRGLVKGQPTRFLRGHRARVPVFIRLITNRRIEGDCWVWCGARNSAGYGRMHVKGAGRYVHRVAYELFVGPYPEWAQHTDHLCRNTMCFNPAHLEPVTARENTLRGVAPSVQNHLAGVCQRGHAMTPDNIYVRPDNGHRQCRECLRMRRRRYAPTTWRKLAERRRTDPVYAERERARKRAADAARRARKAARA